MKKIIEHLKATGDFLSFSRLNEYSINLPIEFKLTCHYFESEINVLICDSGIIQFEPNTRTSKDIIISSGIHGNETAPIEISDQLIKNIFSGKIKLRQRVLFIFGNIKAINQNKRFIDENLNRLFCSAYKMPNSLSNYERIRANNIENFVNDFYKGSKGDSLVRSRYHYDLHTAIRDSKYEKFAIAPYLHGKEQSKRQLQFLNACGINTILLSKSATTTLSYFTSKTYSAHAYTLELGKAKRFGQNNLKSFSAIRENLSLLLSDEPISLKDFDNNDFNIFEVFKTIIKNHESFKFNFKETVENFSEFPIDKVIASESNTNIKITKQKEAIVFPVVFRNLCHFSIIKKTGMTHDSIFRLQQSIS